MNETVGKTNKKGRLTGYPSIDKPWLKYYSDEAINAPLPKMTMYDYAWENNKNDLKDIAFRYFGTKITYGQFFDKAKQAAQSFWALGVRKGDIVTIMSMHTPETIYALYGLNYIGAVANMVYMTLSEKEILHTLQHTESKLFLVLDPALPRVEKIRDQIKVPVVVLSVADSMPFYMKTGYKLKNSAAQKGGNEKRGGLEKDNYNFREFLQMGKRGCRELSVKSAGIIGTSKTMELQKSTDHASLAVIVYTSGTTGEPKGVCLDSDNLNAVTFQYLVSGIGFERKKTFLFMLPPFVGFGVGMLHLAICSGVDSVLWIQMQPEMIAKKFSKMRPNYFVSGPLLVDFIMEYDVDLSNILIFAGGGASLTIEKEREINQFLKKHNSLAKYVTGYGATETASTVCTGMNHVYREGSLGIPMIKANFKIVDVDSKKEISYGEIGEICVTSPSLMKGYYENDRAGKEIIEIDEAGKRWLHTGDLGYIDQDGFVFIKGRIKRIFVTKANDGMAYKIFPQRIEELFLGNSKVDMCGVVVRGDERKVNVPIVYVSLKNDLVKLADKNEESEKKRAHEKKVIAELEILAEQELPEHMRPAEIHIIDKMPMTASGKIDYRELERMQQ